MTTKKQKIDFIMSVFNKAMDPDVIFDSQMNVRNFPYYVNMVKFATPEFKLQGIHKITDYEDKCDVVFAYGVDGLDDINGHVKDTYDFINDKRVFIIYVDKIVKSINDKKTYDVLFNIGWDFVQEYFGIRIDNTMLNIITLGMLNPIPDAISNFLNESTNANEDIKEQFRNMYNKILNSDDPSAKIVLTQEFYEITDKILHPYSD